MGYEVRASLWLLVIGKTGESDASDHPQYVLHLWRDLMLKSGMLSFMDAQACTQWHQNLEDGDLTAISEANILSTFEQLHQSKAEVFERGIINVFKGLSWDYKTNSPCFFGKKIIINNLVTQNRWGFSLTWGF